MSIKYHMPEHGVWKETPKTVQAICTFQHCKFKDCAYSHVQDGNIKNIDDFGKEVEELPEYVKSMSEILDNLKERDKIRDIEVTNLKESLANMARTCEKLKLETNKNRK